MLTSSIPAGIVPDVIILACPSEPEHPKSLNRFTVPPVIVKSTLNASIKVNLNTLFPVAFPRYIKLIVVVAGAAVVVVVVGASVVVVVVVVVVVAVVVVVVVVATKQPS